MLDSAKRATLERSPRSAWNTLALLMIVTLMACTGRRIASLAEDHACFDPSRLVVEVAIENPSAASQPLSDVRVEGSAWFAFEILADALPESIPARSSVLIPIRANRRAFEDAVVRKDPSQAGPPIGRGGPLGHHAGDAALTFRVGERPGAVALAFRPRPQAGDRLGLGATALAMIAASWIALLVILAAFPRFDTIATFGATFRERLYARVDDAARELSSRPLLLGISLMLVAMPLGSLSVAHDRGANASAPGSSCLAANGFAELSVLDGEWAGAAMLVGIGLLITHEMLQGRVGRLAAHFAIAGAVVLAYATRGMSASLRGPIDATSTPSGVRGGAWASSAVSALLDAVSSPMTLAAIAFLIGLVALHRGPPHAPPQLGRDRRTGAPVAAPAFTPVHAHARGKHAATTNHFTLALLWVCVFPGAWTLPVELPGATQGSEILLAMTLRIAGVIGVHLVCARLAEGAHTLRRGSLEAWSLAAVAVALAMFAALPAG